MGLGVRFYGLLFSVHSAKSLIDGVTLGEGESATWWVKMVPIKVNVMCWKMAVNGLPMRLNMSGH